MGCRVTIRRKTSNNLDILLGLVHLLIKGLPMKCSPVTEILWWEVHIVGHATFCVGGRGTREVLRLMFWLTVFLRALCQLTCLLCKILF